MENLSLVDKAFAEKKKPGKSGQPVALKTNCTRIVLTQNIPFYKFSVRMVVLFAKGEKELTKQTKDDYCEQTRKLATVEIFLKLVKENSSFFGKPEALAYDRQAILFSLKEFKITGDAKVFDLPANFSTRFPECTGFKVTIKKCTDNYQVSSNDLKKALTVRPQLNDVTILEVLNLWVSQEALLNSAKFKSFGKAAHYLHNTQGTVFTDSDLPPLSDGKYLSVGVQKSVKIYEPTPGVDNAAYVVIDVSKSAFHTKQPLLEKIASIMRSNVNSLDVRKTNDRFRSIIDQLKGVVCETHDKIARKTTVEIFSFGQPANQSKFNKDGYEIDVAKYFEKTHGIKLHYPGLNTITTRMGGRVCHYPVEALIVGDGQRVNHNQQTEDQTRIMIRTSASLPMDRHRQTDAMKGAIGLNDKNAYLKEAKIKIEPNFLEVNGRLLAMPTICYAGGVTVKPGEADSLNNSWKHPQKGRFVICSTLSKWMIVSLCAPDNIVSQFGERLVQRMQSFGMSVSSPAYQKVAGPSDIENLMSSLSQQGNCDLVMFVADDKTKMIGDIQLASIRYQVLVQNVKLSRVFDILQKGKVETLDNIIKKTNVKLGGLNHEVDSVYLRKHDPNPVKSDYRMFVGFEFSHPPASSNASERESKNALPTVIGYAANCGKHGQQVIGDYKFTPSRQSDKIGEHLGELVTSLIHRFKSNRAKPPGALIFMFNGIEAGQWDLIIGPYMESVRKAVKSLHPSYSPKLSAIAVCKEHTERLYNKNIAGRNASAQNIRPGTVVDSAIVSGIVSEFFLNSHPAMQGTVRTPKYSILVDELNYDMDTWENMINSWSYLHNIVNMPIGVPALLKVASESAKRGATVYATAQRSSGGSLTCETANQELTNFGRKLGQVRYNA